MVSLSCLNSAATSCSFASGQSSKLSLKSSGALRAELDAPSGQQENSETGSYEGVSETWQPFPGLPVVLLFWFWSFLLLGVTFYCKVLPWIFAVELLVRTWIFALFPVHFPPAALCTHMAHTHKDMEKKEKSCEVKKSAHSEVSTVVKTTSD